MSHLLPIHAGPEREHKTPRGGLASKQSSASACASTSAAEPRRRKRRRKYRRECSAERLAAKQTQCGSDRSENVATIEKTDMTAIHADAPRFPSIRSVGKRGYLPSHGPHILPHSATPAACLLFSLLNALPDLPLKKQKISLEEGGGKNPKKTPHHLWL